MPWRWRPSCWGGPWCRSPRRGRPEDRYHQGGRRAVAVLRGRAVGEPAALTAAQGCGRSWSLTGVPGPRRGRTSRRARDGLWRWGTCRQSHSGGDGTETPPAHRGRFPLDRGPARRSAERSALPWCLQAHRDPRLRGTYASGGASGRQLSHYFGRKAEYIDFEKSGAIFGPPARQVVDHPQDDRPGLAAVAGDRGELVEDGAVHLDLLRLGEVEL